MATNSASPGKNIRESPVKSEPYLMFHSFTFTQDSVLDLGLQNWCIPNSVVPCVNAICLIHISFKNEI